MEGVFAKKFSGAGEDSAVGACGRLQSRACGRGLAYAAVGASTSPGLAVTLARQPPDHAVHEQQRYPDQQQQNKIVHSAR